VNRSPTAAHSRAATAAHGSPFPSGDGGEAGGCGQRLVVRGLRRSAVRRFAPCFHARPAFRRCTRKTGWSHTPHIHSAGADARLHRPFSRSHSPRPAAALQVHVSHSLLDAKWYQLGELYKVIPIFVDSLKNCFSIPIVLV